MFSQLVACQEELLAAEDEKRRLNSYLEQILSDIEQRAPALKKQRDEYERAVTTVNDLSKQLEELREANQTDSDAAESYKRKLEVSLRDADRANKLNKDLGQVKNIFENNKYIANLWFLFFSKLQFSSVK